MSPESGGREKPARALDDEVDAKISPGDVAGIGVGRVGQVPVADQDRAVVFGSDRTAPAALDAVELDQVGERRRVALDLVDVDDVEAIAGSVRSSV